MAMIIPSERRPGEYTLDIRSTEIDGVTEVWLLPSADRLREGGVEPENESIPPERLMQFDRTSKRFTIYPFYTRPGPGGEFKPKHDQLESFTFDWEDPDETVDEGTVETALEAQPVAFTRDPDYGLGIKQRYRSIIHEIAELTALESVYIGRGEARDDEFHLPLGDLEDLRGEIDRIDSRAKAAENEIKRTTAYNFMAERLGLDARPFRIGRTEIRNLIQRYAADPNFTDPALQDELVTKVTSVAASFARRNPESADAIVSDIQLTRLETAIQEFEALIDHNHNENKWQQFFEADPFLLSFAFGYPVSIVNGQCYVGGRRIDGKGEKIGDFLFKNSISNNAALIEIKKPQTLLLKKYREDVFAPHDELSGGITQVLNQRYQLTSNFAQHMKDNEWWGDNALADFEVDCVLIAGRMPESKAERRSLQLYRKNSHGVNIVTFDEMLQSLKQVLAYMKDNPVRETANAAGDA